MSYSPTLSLQRIIMESDNRLRLTEDRIANNPAVDPKVVKEAERARQELETLGDWEESGSRVRNPIEIRPNLRPHGQRISQLISQSESPLARRRHTLH